MSRFVSMLALLTVVAVPWSSGCESAPDRRGSERGESEAESASTKEERARASLQRAVDELENLLGDELVSEDEGVSFDRALKERAKRVRTLKKEFEEVITEYRHEPTATAALFHLARMYLDLGCEIALHPAPRKLSTCQHGRYRETLAAQGANYLADAREVLRRAVELDAGDTAERAETLLSTIDVPDDRAGAFTTWRTCHRTRSSWTPESGDDGILDLVEVRIGPDLVEFRVGGGRKGNADRTSSRSWRETSIGDFTADVESTRAAGADAYYLRLAPSTSYERLVDLLYSNNDAFTGRLLSMEIGSHAPFVVASPELPAPDAPRTIPGSTAGHVNIGLEPERATLGSRAWNKPEGDDPNMHRKPPRTGTDPLALARRIRDAEAGSDDAESRLRELREVWDWGWLRRTLDAQWPPPSGVEGDFTLGLSLHPEFPVDLLWPLHELDCGGGRRACRARCKHLLVLGSHVDNDRGDDDS